MLDITWLRKVDSGMDDLEMRHRQIRLDQEHEEESQETEEDRLRAERESRNIKVEAALASDLRLAGWIEGDYNSRIDLFVKDIVKRFKYVYGSFHPDDIKTFDDVATQFRNKYEAYFQTMKTEIMAEFELSALMFDYYVWSYAHSQNNHIRDEFFRKLFIDGMNINPSVMTDE
jgi:hypothetical protein